MDLNAVPWTTAEVIDFACLVAATLMVVAFPVIYGSRANLRDPLARVMILATSATALAFLLSVFFTLYFHTGQTIDEAWSHWIARGIYLTIGAGKLLLLFQVLRSLPRSQRRD